MKSPTAIRKAEPGQNKAEPGQNKVCPLLFWTFLLAMFAPQLLQAAPTIPQLKEHVSVEGPLVRLTDLFENTGLKGSKAVFRAPDPGTTGKVSVNRILAAARKHGLLPSSPPPFHMVTITRTSRVIEIEELKQLIRDAIQELAGHHRTDGNLIIKLRDERSPLHIASSIKGKLRLSSFNWSRQSGRFTARVAVGGHLPIQLTGTASQMVQIIVAKYEIDRGKLISRTDLELKYVQRSRQSRRDKTLFEDLIGLSAKRRLPAGRPVRATDLEAPRLIHKNQLVTILLEAPGLVLRTEGKALGDAARGETVKVLNTQSKRIIHATAMASGLVFVKLSQRTESGS